VDNVASNATQQFVTSTDRPSQYVGADNAAAAAAE